MRTARLKRRELDRSYRLSKACWSPLPTRTMSCGSICEASSGAELYIPVVVGWPHHERTHWPRIISSYGSDCQKDVRKRNADGGFDGLLKTLPRESRRRRRDRWVPAGSPAEWALPLSDGGLLPRNLAQNHPSKAP